MDYKLAKSPNGLNILYAPIPIAQSVNIGFWVKTGSRYESKEENGLAHFLEHMVFKGTKNRPNSYDILVELDELGGSFNAFTSTEYTGFYIQTLPNLTEKAFSLLSDIIVNPLFKKEEIDKERLVIEEEINRYLDSPSEQVFDDFFKLMYGDTPLGRETLGSKETMRTFTPQTFFSFVERYYNLSHLLLVVAGQYDKTTINGLVDSHLKSLSKGKPIRPNTSKISDVQKTERTRNTDQAHFILGADTISYMDSNSITAQVLGVILGGGMSSRMFNEIREKRGLAYAVFSLYKGFSDTGVILTYAGVAKSKLETAINVVKEEHFKIAKEGVKEEELERAKTQLKTQLLVGLESTPAISGFLGKQQILRGEIKTPTILSKEIDGVTSEKLAKLAGDVFKEEKFKLAIIK